MKKLITVLLVFCLACLMLPAMADESVAGVWIMDRIVSGDQVLDSSLLALAQAEMKLELREDGTFSDREAIGDDITEFSGTWVMAEDTILLTPIVPDGEDVEASVVLIQGEELVIHTAESIIYLVRDTGAEVPGSAEEPKPVAADDISKFDGEYAVTGVSIMGMSLSLADLGMDSQVVLTVQDGNGHLVSTYANGYVWEEDVTSEFQDGKLITSPITMGAGMGNLIMEISLQEDGSLFAVTRIPFQGIELDATFVLVPTDQLNQEPAA